MAAQVSGAYKRSRVGYSGARVWGTGVNPIHGVYGAGPPLRVTGRDESRHQAPGEAPPEDLTRQPHWGYTTEDTQYYQDVDWDHRPPVGTPTQDFRYTTHGRPPVNASGAEKEQFRAQFDGAHSYWQETVKEIPSETVTEGWRNKPKGDPADSQPPDPSQLIVQTSEVQRNKVRTNAHAVQRGTDVPRADIRSRVTGQKLKIYSGEERHYDMFPYQQDTMLRAFWYRTAGTGRVWWMKANMLTDRTPIQRVPPADPALGVEETQMGSTDFGYTGEDQFYA